MPVIDVKHRTFAGELTRIRPLIASADEPGQSRLLDEEFAHAGLDPTWAQWRAWACAVLPAYRDGWEAWRDAG